MHSIHLYLYIILFSISVSALTPRHIYHQQDNYFDEDKFTPGFLTLGQKYSIAIGSTVVLPCKINETGTELVYIIKFYINLFFYLLLLFSFLVIFKVYIIYISLNVSYIINYHNPYTFGLNE